MKPTILGLLLLAACGNDGGAQNLPDADPGTDELLVGIIDFLGESADVLMAPATAQVGMPVSVTVSTYGGGCESASSMDTSANADTVTLVPYDRTYRQPGDICTSVLRRLPHTTQLTFPSTGTWTIVVRGRRQTISQPDSIVEIQQTLAVQ